MTARRQVLLRLDPAVHDALMRWAGDEFRSLNAQVEVLLRRALTDAGRMPRNVGPLPQRGRPRATTDTPTTDTPTTDTPTTDTPTTDTPSTDTPPTPREGS